MLVSLSLVLWLPHSFLTHNIGRTLFMRFSFLFSSLINKMRCIKDRCFHPARLFMFSLTPLLHTLTARLTLFLRFFVQQKNNKDTKERLGQRTLPNLLSVCQHPRTQYMKVMEEGEAQTGPRRLLSQATEHTLLTGEQ